MYTKMILLIVFAVISKYLYYQFKQSEEMFESNEHYKLVSEYFLEERDMNDSQFLEFNSVLV